MAWQYVASLLITRSPQNIWQVVNTEVVSINGASEPFIDALQRLGADGWTPAGLVLPEGSNYRVYLKRQAS